MWESTQDLLWRNASHRFTEDLLRAFLYRLLQALDYLHSEAQLIHTDISARNVLVEIADHSIITAFIKAEQNHPSSRKVVNWYTIYASRGFDLPKCFGEPVLSDFGSAVSGDIGYDKYVQPDVYRSPEVCLQVTWSYSIDIWNVGVLIWDLFEAKFLFNRRDPEDSRYSTRQWRGEIPLSSPTSLDESEENLEGNDQAAFLRFMRKMLQWDPERRQMAKQLLQDPWLTGVDTG
ncbi:MAG: hypothetical protein M1820_003749 [Bogoriella megaspora]|nr:MAG: hypothetical protein M1820_003749 [Bogoriella megaspora]